MAPINYDLFWSNYIDHCDLERLQGILSQLDLTELVHALREDRNFFGRKDSPVEAMLRSIYAMSVLQHRSTESFRRELMHNPTLMVVLGFELKPSARTNHRMSIRGYRTRCLRRRRSAAFVRC